MTRLWWCLLVVNLCAGALVAQEDHKPQFHGFFTQSFVYSNSNNYLGMNTSAGTVNWTEGALDVNEQVTDRLRVGIQIHTTKFGAFGSWVPGIDWALADYKVRPWVNVRAGKVKIRWGLYNDTQDADPGYLWSLLPEPIYALDWRATNLSQMGVELYGKARLGRHRGELEYTVYYGYYTYASNDGYLEAFKEEGLPAFTQRPRGKTPGTDLRWKTPVRGLTFGASLMVYNAHGNLVDGAFSEPFTYWPTYYAQYNRKKLFLSAQYMTLVEHDVVNEGTPATSVSRNRAWFAMAGYNLTDKLTLGAYYTRNTLTSERDPNDPSNRYRDWVISSRYTIDQHVYTKLEGHFIDGNGLGFYDFNNPNGLKPHTPLLVAKVGFTF